MSASKDRPAFDLLGSLVERALGREDFIEPRLPSIFEPDPARAAPSMEAEVAPKVDAGWDEPEILSEVDVARVPIRPRAPSVSTLDADGLGANAGSRPEHPGLELGPLPKPHLRPASVEATGGLLSELRVPPVRVTPGPRIELDRERTPARVRPERVDLAAASTAPIVPGVFSPRTRVDRRALAATDADRPAERRAREVPAERPARGTLRPEPVRAPPAASSVRKDAVDVARELDPTSRAQIRSLREPALRVEPPASESPAVEITIGRIEIRATPSSSERAPTPRRKPDARAPKTLEQYLSERGRAV